MICYKCVIQYICLPSIIRQLLAIKSKNYGFWGITGSFEGPWGTYRVIQPESSGYGRQTSSPRCYLEERKKSYQVNFEKSTFQCENRQKQPMWGHSRAPWGTLRVIQPEPSCYTRQISSRRSYIDDKKKSYQTNFEKSTFQSENMQKWQIWGLQGPLGYPWSDSIRTILLYQVDIIIQKLY